MTIHKRLAVIDFDSTLFDMIGFMLALPLAVERLLEINREVFKTEMKAYYVKENGEAVGYDIHAHLSNHGIDLRDEAVHQPLIDAILAAHFELSGQPDLLFVDARELLANIKSDQDTYWVIMSLNLETGFDFKLRLCGRAIEGIETRVVRSNKGKILAKEWSDTIVWNDRTYEFALVIDDGPSQIEAVPDRPNIERVQIFRPGQRYPRTTNPKIRVESSLAVNFTLAA